MELHVVCSANLGRSLGASGASTPGQNALNALLCGQYEAPEEAPNLPDAQRHTSPREALKAVKLLRVEPCGIFFNPPASGCCAARSTVNNA